MQRTITVTAINRPPLLLKALLKSLIRNELIKVFKMLSST